MRNTIGSALTAAGLLVTTVALGSAPDEAVDVSFFESRVRPILVQRCHACHSAETKPAGGLRVDDRRGLIDGGESGPAVVPGNPEASLLLVRIAEEGKRRMPKEGQPLTAEETAILARWISAGAPWPPARAPGSLGRSPGWYESVKKEHWAWRPLEDPDLPVVRDDSWSWDPIDRFILARLELEGLVPTTDADRSTWLRRVHYDLTGLPPTADETRAFLADRSSDAESRVVDRLLDSRAYAEHWARHWLDVARYGESTGPSRNIPYPFAWRYRDYVIDAVANDFPFDRFIREQVAGDLLPANSPQERDRLATATGFLALGVKDVNQRFKTRFLMDNVDEQIDVVSRAFLGLTVSCARCHDHKFDPIPTTDYYALAGIFTSTDNASGVRNKMGGGGLDYYDPAMLIALSVRPVDPPGEAVKALEGQVAEARKAWNAIRGTPEGLMRGPDGLPRQRGFRVTLEKLESDLSALTNPAGRGFAIHGVREARVIADTEVRIRGEAEKLGPIVPRGFLSVIDVPGSAPVDRSRSGRLELAHWISSPANPLTARVAVNRIWSHLFTQGIVSTVDNFGTMGDAPSHPELLDHLALRFIRNGWSVRSLIRSIVLSHSYRLDSRIVPRNQEVDPANRLVWRHSPRRLSSEEMRDSILQVVGRLGGEPPKDDTTRMLRMVEIRDNGPEARAIQESASSSTSRSLYLPALRGITPRSLEVFDPVDQTLVSGRRDCTNVPAQALFMLNSGFVRKQASSFEESVLTLKTSDSERIHASYEAILGRAPAPSEVDLARRFLSEYALACTPGEDSSGHRGDAPRSPSSRSETILVSRSKPSEAPPTTAPSAEPPAPSQRRLGLPKSVPANPDDIDQTGESEAEEVVVPRDPSAAAWTAFVQALIGSAEFRFVR